MQNRLQIPSDIYLKLASSHADLDDILGQIAADLCHALSLQLRYCCIRVRKIYQPIQHPVEGIEYFIICLPKTTGPRCHVSWHNSWRRRCKTRIYTFRHRRSRTPRCRFRIGGIFKIRYKVSGSHDCGMKLTFKGSPLLLEILPPSPDRIEHQRHTHPTPHLQLQRTIHLPTRWSTRSLVSSSIPPQLCENLRQSVGQVIC